MKLFLYARKSTDREDKQTESLPNQIRLLTKLAVELWHDIVEIIEESVSAKAPWRPLFNKMVKDLEAWKAEWVLCWKIDRLFRNPLDAGKIQMMMQDNVIKLIQTHDRAYKPEDNVIMLAVESGMAHQYINDLRKNVVRGMENKIDMWWYPWQAPVWYENDSQDRTIVTDKLRFHLVKKMWDTMLMWCYSVPQILKMATDEWWLDLRKTRKKPARKLTLSATYNLFRNIFYTWQFIYAGQRFQWKHTPMVTLEQFLRVQDILDGKKVNSGTSVHEHAYTWFIRCAECWYHITCDVKRKKLAKSWEITTYHYYKCTGKCTKPCSQVGKSVRSNELEEQIESVLSAIEIRPEFREWWIRMVREHFSKENEMIKIRLDAMDSKIWKLNSKKKQLLDCLLEWIVSKSEYEQRKKEIEDELIVIEAQKQTLSQSSRIWAKKVEDSINFMAYARKWFLSWTPKQRREIVRSLGQNFSMRDRKLNIQLHSWLQPIAQNNTPEGVKFGPLEPKENLSGTAIAIPWEVDTSEWWTLIQQIITKMQEEPMIAPFPTLDIPKLE